jgi:hypothetical protein
MNVKLNEDISEIVEAEARKAKEEPAAVVNGVLNILLNIDKATMRQLMAEVDANLQTITRAQKLVEETEAEVARLRARYVKAKSDNAALAFLMGQPSAHKAGKRA